MVQKWGNPSRIVWRITLRTVCNQKFTTLKTVALEIRWGKLLWSQESNAISFSKICLRSLELLNFVLGPVFIDRPVFTLMRRGMFQEFTFQVQLISYRLVIVICLCCIHVQQELNINLETCHNVLVPDIWQWFLDHSVKYFETLFFVNCWTLSSFLQSDLTDSLYSPCNRVWKLLQVLQTLLTKNAFKS